MPTKVVNILGNGDRAHYWNDHPRKGMNLLCNMPPWEVDPKEVYATCMVDFKMMMALTEGSIGLDQYRWVLGTRPRIWMYERSTSYEVCTQRSRVLHTRTEVCR